MKLNNIKILFFLLSGFMLLHSPASAQSFDLAGLRSQFATHADQSLQEKIFVHSDKELYLAGEMVWFKIYYVNARNLKPLQLSRVAYVELLDQQNRPVLQAKISIDSTGGDGSFYIPVTVESGYYTLRSYTSWMKNFGPELFFEKQLAVINTLKSPIAPFIKNSSSAFIDFFPEGGNLVKDLRSKLGFRVTDQAGKGMDCSGILVNSNGDTTARFSTLKFGIGSFDVQPLSGQEYTAFIKLPNGQVVSKQLPRPLENGYVMSVLDDGAGKLRVNLHTAGTAGQRDREVFLVAHSRQEIRVAEKALVNNNDAASFVIDKTKLGTGVVHFTIFNRDGQPVCERLYFSGKPGITPNTIRTNASDYQARRKVDVAINAGPAYGTGQLSISVFMADSIVQDVDDIRSYYWLSSELAGVVESPSYYFSNEPGVPQALDNLMLVQGWRRFNWDPVLKQQKPLIKSIPEIKGHILTAKLTTPDGKSPNRKVDVFLSIPNTKTGFYASETDSTGIVHFDVKDYYGVAEIYVQVLNPRDSMLKITIANPFYESQTPPVMQQLSLHPEMSAVLQKRNIGMQVQNIYSGDSMQKFRPAMISDTLPFFGRADYTYKLDNYTRFTTMEEVLREYVLPVNVYMQGGKPHLKVFNFTRNEFYEDEVLVLLDGVALRNRNAIFNYNPAKVQRLDIIPQAYVLGSSRFDAILGFTTYDRVFDGYDLNPSLIAIDYDGLQARREFYSPQYQSSAQVESRLPDFRSTLYWSPSVKIDEAGSANFSFYTSDQPGNYIILAQGISNNGETLVSKTQFTVNKK